jgi:hypothetical protein
MGSLVQRVLSPILARLGSRTILGIGGALFVLNMIIPDPIPLVDEFLILVATILLSRWAGGDPADATTDTAATDATRAHATDSVGTPKHVGRGSTSR